MLSLVTNYGQVSILTSALRVLKWQQINLFSSAVENRARVKREGTAPSANEFPDWSLGPHPFQFKSESGDTT